MAAGGLSWPLLDEGRGHARADVDRQRAALDEATALGRIDRSGREELKKEILKAIRQNTDVKVDEVLFTDVAVQ